MPSEKQVIFLKRNKKIALFIAEGITDQISLALVLSKIIEKDKLVRFKVINGDITSENGTSPSNILNKITEAIKEFMVKGLFEKNDIQYIIHLVDTDGVYADNKFVLSKDIDGVEYDTQYMYTRYIENIIKRNEQKSQILNKLIGTEKVYTNLPYKIYFFSSNLEHVLHNSQNVSADDKLKYAQAFEDKFADDPFSFIEFINSVEFAIRGDYHDTWDFVKMNTNSLKRYTNFHLYINEVTKE